MASVSACAGVWVCAGFVLVSGEGMALNGGACVAMRDNTHTAVQPTTLANQLEPCAVRRLEVRFALWPGPRLR